MSALEQLVANMTVAQLADLAGTDVDSMVALVLGKSKRGVAPKTAQTGRRGRKRAEAGDASVAAQNEAPAPSQGHNTRTRAGRDALDAAILTFLKEQSDPVRALDIRKGVGGTAAQVRTRLNFLIEKKRVNYTGRASGTRYKSK
ncbi:MAG: hypothetical protein AAF799_15520 [Myxococcota bacterium]